jgi:hypothetical protein
MPLTESIQDRCWITHWSQALRGGADPRLVHSQIQRYAESGRVPVLGFSRTKQEVKHGQG